VGASGRRKGYPIVKDDGGMSELRSRRSDRAQAYRSNVFTKVEVVATATQERMHELFEALQTPSGT